MPTPSASQFTQLRRLQSEINSRHSESALKLRAPGFYSSYTPFYRIGSTPINFLRSNKFTVSETIPDPVPDPEPPVELPAEWLLFDPDNITSYDPDTPDVLSNIGSYGDYVGTLSSTSNVQYLTGTNTSRKVLYFNGFGRITFGAFDFVDSFTITTWIRPLANVNINAIIATGPANVGTEGFKFTWNSYASPGDQNNSIVLENGGVGGVGWQAPATAPDTITLNAWQHLALVYDNSDNTAYIYKNGVDIPFLSGNSTSEIDLSSSSVSIGSYVGGTFRMKAELGLLKVFNSVLTAEEVAGDYNNTKASFGILNI